MSDKKKQLLFSVTIKDCDVQTFRAGGKGGQNQNKVEAGVRVIHRASGAVGESREDRSQLTNKRNAFRRMAQTKEFREWNKAEVERRLGQSAEQGRAGRVGAAFGMKYVRTYDFPDRQVKDHRTGHTRHDLENVLNGDIDSFIDAMLRA